MKDLASYLNDHLAGSVGAIELTDHCLETFEGDRLAAFFQELKKEIEQDRDKLRELMRVLDVPESTVRKSGAWLAEKLGRARLSIAGNKTGALGLLLALEILELGITGKQLLWRALQTARIPALAQFDLAELERRAREQVETVEAERARTARAALQDR